MDSAELLALPYYKIVESAGNDRAWLVMLHGATQHSGVFSSQVESFQNQYRLLLIDLPGHGRSAHLPGPYGLVEYAASVGALLERLGIQEMHFWGTHTGAGVGLLLAATSRGKGFRSLILDGAVLPGVYLASVAASLSRAKATALASGVEAARHEWFNEAAWFDVIRGNPQRCRSADHWAMISEFTGGPWLDKSEPKAVHSIEQALAGLTTPTLLINGEHDLAEFKSIAERIATLLPNSQRYTVPGGGGFPLWEFPHEVNSHVAGFLRRLNG